MRRILILLCILLSLSVSRAQDTLKVLCIGNSFTYVENAYGKLAEIAESQGHHIEMTAVYVGGYSFNRHLHDLKSIIAIEEGVYDCVFLQDQSQMHARYADDTLRFAPAREDTRSLVSRIRMYSPCVRIWLENTWAFQDENFGGFGNMERFDSLLVAGASMLAEDSGVNVSPIGPAFAKARKGNVVLYDPDGRHQSAYGSYLKACVNYLVIYGERFCGRPTNCGLDSSSCEYLRAVAETTVLGDKPLVGSCR